MKSNLDLARECGAAIKDTTEHWHRDSSSRIAMTDVQLDTFAERIRADERAALVSAPVQTAVTVEHDSTPLPAGMPEPVAAQIREGFGDWVEHPLASALAGGFWAGFQVRFLYTAAQVQAMLAQGLAPGWKAVPVEPTPEIIAAAAIASWPVATLADIEIGRKAAPIILMALDSSDGVTVGMLAATIATMAPAYRAMITAAPKPPAAQSSPTAVERKPLTDDELDLMCEKALFCRISFQQFARSIEAAHGITAAQKGGQHGTE